MKGILVLTWYQSDVIEHVAAAQECLELEET